MAGKEKKTTAAKKKKPVYTGKKSRKGGVVTSRNKRGSNEEIRSYLFGFSSGGKSVSKEIVKVLKFSTDKRKFEIWLLKDEKKKKLIFHVVELIEGETKPLADQRIEIKMPDIHVSPEKVPGYSEFLTLVKRSVRDYADTATGNIKKFLWSQFGAAIDMLNNAIRHWPEDAWETDKGFFYNAYHALVFLDYYLTDPAMKFKPVLPFTLMGRDIAPAESIDDVVPNRVYTKEELVSYGEVLKKKCKSVISLLNEEKLGSRWIEKDGNMNYGWLEILLYNMRHVQHHAAQLNMLLRQKINDAPTWVGREKSDL